MIALFGKRWHAFGRIRTHPLVGYAIAVFMVRGWYYAGDLLLLSNLNAADRTELYGHDRLRRVFRQRG